MIMDYVLGVVNVCTVYVCHNCTHAGYTHITAASVDSSMMDRRDTKTAGPPAGDSGQGSACCM